MMMIFSVAEGHKEACIGNRSHFREKGSVHSAGKTHERTFVGGLGPCQFLSNEPLLRHTRLLGSLAKPVCDIVG